MPHLIAKFQILRSSSYDVQGLTGLAAVLAYIRNQACSPVRFHWFSMLPSRLQVLFKATPDAASEIDTGLVQFSPLQKSQVSVRSKIDRVNVFSGTNCVNNLDQLGILNCTSSRQLSLPSGAPRPWTAAGQPPAAETRVAQWSPPSAAWSKELREF